MTRTPPDPSPSGRALVFPHRPWIERLRSRGVRPDRWFKAPPPENRIARVEEGPRSLQGKLYDLVRASLLQALTWPDPVFDWTWRARRGLEELVRTRPPDAILSTSPPESTHLLARRAHRISRAPWIADLRDPWADNEMMFRPRWRRALDRATERRVFQPTATLVTVSEPLADNLRRDHPEKRVVAITNGFDPDEFPAPAPVDRRRFRIGYTGGLWLGQHAFVDFLEGARLFLDRNPQAPLEIEFLGETSPVLKGAIERFGLSAHVTLRARVPHHDAVAAMRGNAVNLFFPWQDPRHPGVYSGKLFEYLGARRPILAVGKIKGVAGELLEEVGLGRMAADANEVERRMTELFQAHLAGKDAWPGEEEKILRHSHGTMAARFADELTRLVAR